MPSDQHLLVVGREALESAELTRELQRRARQGTVRAFLLAPTTNHDRGVVHARLSITVRRWTAAGVIAIGIAGDADPVAAVDRIWNPVFYDEVLVCSPPARICRWLRLDLPSRIAKLTGAKVFHVVAYGTGDRRRSQPPSGCSRR